MLKIEKEHLEYLNNNKIDILFPAENDDLSEVLEIIDDAIVENIVTHNDEPDDHGIFLQKIYDRIRADNMGEDV